MDLPAPAGARPPAGAAAPPEALLRETLAQLEEVRARAGTGEIADRLATVCDRLRSAHAALAQRPAAPGAGSPDGEILSA